MIAVDDQKTTGTKEEKIMSEEKKTYNAYLYSAAEPTKEQKIRFCNFLKKTYGKDYTLVFKQDDTLGGGFRLRVGSNTYDWSNRGRLQQLKEMLQRIEGSTNNVTGLIREKLSDWSLETTPYEEGVVKTVGDGIAIVSALSHVTYGEIVEFDCGVKGMVQDLRKNEVGVILFSDDDDISEGSRVRRTGRTAGMPVGDAFLGRVIDPLGQPIDGKGEVYAEGYRAIESPAPGIIERQPVDTPMDTGILAIDAMFPIGRGQRELIIGDRQTGKTSVAIDTILNQKGKDVICIYVAIGQKSGSVAQLVSNLEKKGAMNYTVVVNASASETAPIQYIAPYSGTALGEFFMNKGKDVLIVYDDLSKHAVAYRSMSLLLERSPGREAFPGDVFYLHSRLLERSAHLADSLGGGSMTALPIVETQAGDVSAYIPTNIISITDGQIFLESKLFFNGQRPAVNVGLSVSRVGGAAQTKAMKKAASSLRLDLAQYREMEVFTQFSSELDITTKRQLRYGEGLMRLLRQPQGSPFTMEEQVILLVAAQGHAMQEIPPEEIVRFRKELLEYFDENEPMIPARSERSKTLSDRDREEIVKIARSRAEAFLKEKN